MIIKYIGTLMLISGMTFLAKAQIHQPRQRFVEIATGLLDGTQLRKTDNTGYWAKISFGKYGRKEGIWQAGVSTQMKFYAFNSDGLENELIRVDQYLLEGTFAPKGFKTLDRILYINPAFTVLGGYERANAGSKGNIEIKENLNKMIIGIAGGLMGEINLSYRVALVLYGKANYLPSSKVQNFHFVYGLGFRFNYFKQ
ncbi:conjugal transfer protein TraO [Xanthocytophaga flava]|uniref:conjugal transfer protein TraO n=1 Tax=Xanthocytophaga flava TaxID=3048013 RepID=UPI0028D7BB3E|nr:conjugal transfer protein TraO [Xanthocytophaga flavus]MDJ1470219.1 conjugal transfer protein TraO [Xanthocytophaga flavus]